MALIDKLGNYIERLDRPNSDLRYGIDDVCGITNTKQLVRGTKANLIGRTFEKFTVLQPREFIFNRRTSRNGERISLGYNTTCRDWILTEDYCHFRVRKDKESILDPDFLYLFFLNPEFDRYARYNSWGSATEFFNWEEIIETPIPMLPIEKQHKIVRDYQVISDRITLLQRIISNIDKNNETRLAKLLSDAVSFDMNTTIKIGSHVEIVRGVSYVPEETKDKPTNGYLPILRANNIVDGNLVYDGLIYVLAKNIGKDQFVTDRSLIIAMSSGSQTHVGKVAMAYGDLMYSYGAFCAKIGIEKAYEGIISTYLKGYWFRSHLEQMLLGTTINNIKREDIEGIRIVIPSMQHLKEFEKRYQTFASYKASIVGELTLLYEIQKRLILQLAEGV